MGWATSGQVTYLPEIIHNLELLEFELDQLQRKKKKSVVSLADTNLR